MNAPATFLPCVAWGVASAAGPKRANQDAWFMVEPDGSSPARRGVLALLADGVSGSADGARAAREAVRELAADFYAAPERWDAAELLPKLFARRHLRLCATEESGMSTLAALVLEGRRAVIANVGDTRVYRVAGGELECLTVDHVHAQPAMRHVLTQALGLAGPLTPARREFDVAPGERFVLATDGVWAVLEPGSLAELASIANPQAAADALVDAALSAGSQDNASALVLTVLSLPVHDSPDEDLPLPGRLAPGDEIDGLAVLERLHDSPGGRVVRVRGADGEVCLLKTLAPRLADDEAALTGLDAEEWLLRRLAGPGVAEWRPHAARTRRYLLLTHHAGATLAERRERREAWSVPQALGLTGKLLKSLAWLHGEGVAHGDIKPDNLHLADDGELRLLDFGAARVTGLIEPVRAAGTPSYMAPELFCAAPVSEASDVYAAGVTVYWLLTGHYPYGELEAFQCPIDAKPVPPSRYRPDIPAWFEAQILKAVARDARDRYPSAAAWLAALARGDAGVPARPSPAKRAALALWQQIALVSLALNLLLFYLWALAR
ncbi:bifunctional protein-serine/threonine kinase/phosphatase [Crenobacter cavernae]|uniref:Bifunctional protein-serine/threonine kinase/phosphatase n=1 Tax=Crenobacter cavernae TaxID=2290923 RepID=A0ABY0FGQ8_9NEIS|nr:bifunctional protein-serine/threonine kinase/phosphatase [Crenobacter cavernae]RXZ45579.1 bifunctional protein-serine/threonine kinase/phosphatase [Crenobacter cavernae]